MSKEKDCRWHFADQIGGREDGPNDAVTQNLKGGAYSTLIREAFQNALDAAQGPASEKGPVRVEISFGAINGLDFPNYNELGAHIQGCLDCFPDNDQARSIYGPMLTRFTDCHYDMNIGYIKVADFNTNGMDYVPETDPEYRKKPFYAFVRSVGVHANDSEGTGGSYGFGKAAYFLISPLRTLMVSTLTNTNRYFFEGVSSLCTHTFQGSTKVSVGFYDNNGGKPVNNQDRIPKPFRRTEAGTDFYLMGVNLSDREKADAIKEMVEASVRNFWMSILDGHLVVKIVDKVIDKDNLADYMERLFPSIVDDTKTALRHNPRPYYEAYIHAGEDDNHKYFSKVIPHLGKVQFFTFLHSSANDRIIYMRDLRMFVYRKKNQTNAAFYGLFLCDDSHGNLLLRDMEPPRHDDWDPEFARKYPKEECRDAKDAYTQFIAECVKQLHPDDSNESLNVLGAQNAYIPESLIDEDNDEGMDSNAGQYGTGGQPTGEYQEEGTSMTTNIDDTTPDTPDTTKGTLGKVRRIDSNWEVDQDGKHNLGIRTRSKNKKKRKGRGNQPGDYKTKGKLSEDGEGLPVYVDASFRPVIIKEGNVLYHDLIIRPEEDVVNGEIELIVGGDQDTLSVPIIYSSEGTIDGNRIVGISLKKDGVNKIRIRFEDNMRHSISLSAYERK